MLGKAILGTICCCAGIQFAGAEVIADFPMDLSVRSITETVTGKQFEVTSKTMPENVSGAKGYALRLDGYSTFVQANFASEKINSNQMTVELWCAAETYPMMNIAEAQNVQAAFFGNIDDSARTGFAFKLYSQGDLLFECYADGWKVSCAANEKLPKYQWNHLVAVVDAPAQKVSVYNNGNLIASSKCMKSFSAGNSELYIGKPKENLQAGPFHINTFNGLIDDVKIHNVAMSAQQVAELGNTAENEVDLSVPESRFESNILRPRFHAMPGACWTNETHGMVKFGGRYHVFFQKNANGPYMARLHWGHISSSDLCTWTEEKIAIDPSLPYDIKGCWSGCVFTDDVLTGGKPNIWYTAVDNARATICHAIPSDDNLVNWVKDSRNPVVNGRPVGLSDDFRDCYVFTANGKYYMIVGTSKDGLGAATLHRYENGNWSNDGSIFFKAASRNVGGRFWEMPNVTKIGDKWLFTVTPLETSVGVETLYWVGNINADGTFSPLPQYHNNPGKFELDGFSRDGYGLLSPSIMQADGKTIALGIVPDKLSWEDNYNIGWAHNYSLPRELDIDSENELVQKPSGNLKALRSAVSYSNANFDLDGDLSLAPVAGRKVEVSAEFEIGSSSQFGLRLLKSNSSSVEIYFTPSGNLLTVDMTKVPRMVNDQGVFNGLYQTSLPKRFVKGDVLKLHVFIDNSIMDIFVNDKWASCIRIFSTSANSKKVEAFSNGTTRIRSLDAWVLDESLSSVSMPVADKGKSRNVYYSEGTLHFDIADTDSIVSLYSVSGEKVMAEIVPSGIDSLPVNLEKGIYVATVKTGNDKSAHKIIIR